VILAADVIEVDRRRGRFHAHVLHGGADDLRDREVAEPLVVRRDHVPRGALGRAFGQHVFVCRHVVVPEGPFLVVRIADLPLPRRVVEPLLEALELLVFRDVEEELHDRRVVLDQELLEVVDQCISSRPHVLGHEVVNANDEDILVVGAIEDGDLAERRRMRMDAPEKIMRAFLVRGLLEADDRAAQRVHAFDHLAAHAVLAGRVHALQHDQKGVLLFRI
jgi:hypothetical protein